MIVLSESDVERLLTMKGVMDAVERTLKALAEGRAHLPLRTRVRSERYGGDILSMPALVEDFGLYTTKIVSVYPENPKRGLPTINASLIVFDASTGTPLALMAASHLTAMRTGAITGVATKYLARRDARVLAVIGCGVQGRTQALGVAEARRLEEVRAYDVVREKAERYAEEMSRRLGIDVRVAGSAEEAVKGADIVVTATTSSEPVVKRSWLSPGVHINAIGAYTPEMRELDTETIVDAKVVVDLREAALAEAGDIIIPIREGAFSEDRIHGELGEIVAGKKPGRESEDEITVFKSVGLAVQDTAAAYVALNNYAEKLKK